MFGKPVPEIEVNEFARKLASGDAFVLLDVREPWELVQAKIADGRMELTPMSLLSSEGTRALSEAARDTDATLYVLCHHGVRSAQVTGWLAAQGWRNVFSVRGGIQAYAEEVDPTVGKY